MSPELRIATASDRAAVLQILRDAFTPYVTRLGRTMEPNAFLWLDTALADGHVRAAVDEGRIVGVVAAEPQGEALHVKVVAVRPDRQGRGLGTWILERIEAAARADGYQALLLETAEVMDDLLRLYERLGFAELRRGPPAHRRDACPRVHLRKAL